MITKVIFYIALSGVFHMTSVASTKADLKWAHAVNSQEELKKNLADTTILMIEGDVIMGQIDQTTTAPPTATPEPKTTTDPTTTEEPKTTTDPTTTEEPTTTTVPTTTEEPTTTTEPTTTEEPTTTTVPTTTEEPKTTTEPTTTEEPKTTTDPTTTEEPKTTAEPTAEPENPDPKPKSISKLLDDNIPIMHHDTDDPKSDLSLEDFLSQIIKEKPSTGIKLDFKQTAALTNGAAIVKTQIGDGKLKGPLFINADIVQGPGGNTPNVVAADFFKSALDISDKAILSLGWTTSKDRLTTVTEYSAAHLKAMTDAIKAANIPDKTEITFAVRAAIVAQSLETMKTLKTVRPTSTLTIWTNKDDPEIDYDKLKEVIEVYGGLDSVYVDVPEETKKKIVNGAATIVFSKLALVLCAIAVFLPNLH